MTPSDYAIIRRLQGLQYFQMRIDYDANNNAIYVGLAPQGAATSDSVWIIQKNTYDGNNNCTLIQTSSPLGNVKWDDRATTVTYS